MNNDGVIFIIFGELFWEGIDKFVFFLVRVSNDIMVCLLEEVWFLFVEVIMFGVLVEMIVDSVSELFFFLVWVFFEVVVFNWFWEIFIVEVIEWFFVLDFVFSDDMIFVEFEVIGRIDMVELGCFLIWVSNEIVVCGLEGIIVGEIIICWILVEVVIDKTFEMVFFFRFGDWWCFFFYLIWRSR